jgi:ribose/xylose/arabinose/galactoside ABC-type transport system permease subunit
LSAGSFVLALVELSSLVSTVFLHRRSKSKLNSSVIGTILIIGVTLDAVRRKRRATSGRL